MYATTKNVAALCKNLINNAADFDAGTVPTKAEVTQWLDEGAAIINNELEAKGYTPPTSVTNSVYIECRRLNVLYAASYAEMARTNISLGPGQRTRGQVFEEMFRKGLEGLMARNLSAQLSHTSTGYVGGISESDKDAVNDNSDRVPNRFTSGQFDNN